MSRFGALPIAASLLALACSDSGTDPGTSVDVTFDFHGGMEGWQGDFADYPVGEESFYELSVEHGTLPAPLNQSEGSIRQSGNNHSDDLFMYVSRKLTGLAPGRSYRGTVTVRFATDAPENSVGVGGSPGKSVYVKAGFSAVEPTRRVDELNHYRLNLDKGNQAQGGADVITIGDFANGTAEEWEFRLKTLATTTPLNVSANDAGELWVVVGTDSGFESTTTIFYDLIQVQLR